MIGQIRLLAAATAALVGASVVCPICDRGVTPAAAQTLAAAPVPTDTATTRLHISGMTCGSCPVTARVALKKLTGVLDATVTLDDSLGVVRYDPAKVTPARIAAHLTRLTGYGARVIEPPSQPGTR